MARPRILPGKVGTAGTVAVEYAIVLPVLLLLTLGAMDIARLLWTNITLARATEAAARCGAVSAATCPTTSLAGYAAGQAWGLRAISADNFTASTPSCGVQVVGTYAFQFLVPWSFGRTTMTLTAAACYPARS